MTLLNKKGGSLNISASAIETFTRCQRKWYFGYVERIRGPKNAAAERGDKIHDLAERYLKGEFDHLDLEGEDAKWWRYLEPGLAFAPTPEEIAEQGWGVEDWVKEPCGPLTFVGKVDFYNIDELSICDWKTTGNTSWRYSKKPVALAHHIQPRVYAYALFKDNPKAHEQGLRFQHVNMQSRGVPGAMEVWATYVDADEVRHDYVPWQEILDTWQEVITISEDMAEVALTNPEAETVEGNTAACRDFGGCPHAMYCTASPMNRATPNIPDVSDKVTVKNTQESKDKMAALRAKLGLESKKAPVITPKVKEPEAPAPEPEPVSTGDQVRNIIERRGSIPHAVLVAIAGDDAPQVAKSLGLEKAGFVWSPSAPAAPWKAGTPLREHEAQHGPGVPEGAKVVAGLLVPEDFDGTAEEAVAEFSTHAGQRAAAEVLEANDPTPPPAEAPAPKPDKDLDLRKAARLLIAEIEEANTLDKGAARDLFVSHTTWRRIGDKRHRAVADAANEWLEAQDMDMRIDFDGSEYAERGIEAYYPSQATEREERAKAGGYPLPIPLPPEQVADTITCQDLAEAPDETVPTSLYVRDLATARDAGKREGWAEGYAEALAEGTGGGPTVYVDCLPLDEDYVLFSQWIAEAEALVAEQKNVPYYGLVPYNEGVRMVAAKAQHAVSEGHLPPAMYVDSDHPVANHFIAIACAAAGVRVIKAA